LTEHGLSEDETLARGGGCSFCGAMGFATIAIDDLGGWLVGVEDLVGDFARTTRKVDRYFVRWRWRKDAGAVARSFGPSWTMGRGDRVSDHCRGVRSRNRGAVCPRGLELGVGLPAGLPVWVSRRRRPKLDMILLGLARGGQIKCKTSIAQGTSCCRFRALMPPLHVCRKWCELFRKRALPGLRWAVLEGDRPCPGWFTATDRAHLSEPAVCIRKSTIASLWRAWMNRAAVAD